MECTAENLLTDSETAHVEFIKMAKVAVATALIRSKPDNLTGQQYTAFLHQKIQAGRDNLEEKCKALERELMELKIKVLSKGDGKSVGSFSSEELPFRLPSTPPSSSERIEKSTSVSLTESDVLTSHTKFLESVSRVKFTSNLLENTMLADKGDSPLDIASDILQGRIVHEQTVRSVDAVLTFVKDITLHRPLTVTKEMCLHSVLCIVNLLNTFEKYLLSSSRENGRKAMEIMTSIVENCSSTSMELQAFIMSTNELTAFKAQNACCDVLFHFAECPSLCPIIVRQLVQGISAVSVHLKTAQDTDSKDVGIPPDFILCENVCYLFKTLGAILRHLLNALHQAQVNASSGADAEHDARTTELAAQVPVAPDSQPPTCDQNEAESMVTEDPKQNKKLGKKSRKKKQVITGNIMEFFHSVKNSQTENPRNDCVSQQEKTHNATPTLSSSTERTDSVQTETENMTTDCQKDPPLPLVSSDSDYERSILSILTGDFVFCLQDAMENALLSNCDEFPLFSYYAWKIGNLVEEIVQTFRF